MRTIVIVNIRFRFLKHWRHTNKSSEVTGDMREWDRKRYPFLKTESLLWLRCCCEYPWAAVIVYLSSGDPSAHLIKKSRLKPISTASQSLEGASAAAIWMEDALPIPPEPSGATCRPLLFARTPAFKLYLFSFIVRLDFRSETSIIWWKCCYSLTSI